MGQRRLIKSSQVQHYSYRDLLSYLSFFIRKYQISFVEIGKGQSRIRLYHLRCKTCTQVLYVCTQQQGLCSFIL